MWELSNSNKKNIHPYKWQDWGAFIVFEESLVKLRSLYYSVFTPIFDNFYSVEMEFQILLKQKQSQRFCFVFGSTLPHFVPLFITFYTFWHIN